MIKTAMVLVLGSVAAFYSSAIPDRYWVSYLPLLLLLAFLNPGYRVPILLIAAYLWACLNIQHSLDLRLAGDYQNQLLELEGVIADIPEQRPGSIRFLFRPDSIAGYPHPLPDTIRLSWYRSDQKINAGERWRLLVKLKSPGGYQNPGGFDYERWLLVKRIGAIGYVKSSDLNQLLESPAFWSIDQWRSQIGQGIDQYCADCSQAGLIKALTIGYRANIHPHQRELLQDTGTAHLLAISGLHIGMISALFFYLGRWIWQLGFYRIGYDRLRFSATLAFSAGLIYAGLAGFSLPTVRALIMLAVVFLALIFRSGINLINSIAIAVVVILIFDPLAVGSASFWLSISALLIIAFAQYLLSHQTSRWRQMMVVQFLFSVLFIPLGIGLFGQLNPASFFANILAIPLVSLIIVPIALLASFLVGFGLSLANGLFLVSDKLLGVLLDYLELLLNSGLSAHPGGSIPYVLLGLSAMGLLIITMPKGFPGKMPAVLLVVLPFIWQRPEIEFGAYQLTLLDVGMGTSAVIQTRNHSIVYDFGPGNAYGFSAAQWVLVPFLRQQGIEQPDLMIISHVDADHSGGFISYREHYDPARLISGTPDEIQKRFRLRSAIRSCHLYPPWYWDGVSFEFISPPATSKLKSSNNRSCVLRVSGVHTSLLTGDIEAEQEFRLLGTMPEKLRASVLLAPHHGSATSSTSSFLQKVSPRVSVFTIGRNNRWGFPDARVLEAYGLVNSQIYRTDRDGAITIQSSASGLKVSRYRKDRPRLWY
ncbi:MAG: DNA internalization-related competence protein ComEC/Rec2 [Proteobacteria bacterium]|nr:DNA internalization-related competence protein ComEC/Rec2 [Pseudomonadota bacterium]